MIRSHLVHLVLYSGIVAAFFAALLRRDWRQALKLGGVIWIAMVGGALALAYLMFPFPR